MENFTEGITKEIVIKVFDRTPGSDVTSPTLGDESVDMRIPFHNGDEHKKQAYRTYEKNEAGYICCHRKDKNGFCNEREQI
jgi:hypothetical protein